MQENRRPLNSRGHPFFVRLAADLAKRSCPTPNQISVLSVVFAALGAWCLLDPNAFTLLMAAVLIQLRLVCNLLDGMVAVEGGKKTAAGALYNEFPDRVADSLLLVALGHATPWPWAGWLAALLAMATAYIRVSGGSLGLPQSFVGPMAKQQRMAVLTAACVLAALQRLFADSHSLLDYSLMIIIAGSAYTCVRRTRLIAVQLGKETS